MHRKSPEGNSAACGRMFLKILLCMAETTERYVKIDYKKKKFLNLIYFIYLSNTYIVLILG